MGLYQSFPLWLNISNFFILYAILHQIFCMYVYVFVQDWYVARNCWGPRVSNLIYTTILPFRFIVPFQGPEQLCLTLYFSPDPHPLLVYN